ncbi:Band 4.1 protein 2 [Dirofilaria immitis]|nr:Band 4.1 protein 2 [Dirofilaria immitis]
MGKKATEDEIGNIQQMTDKQPATVQFLDFTKHIFYVSDEKNRDVKLKFRKFDEKFEKVVALCHGYALKKAEGGELFDKACAFIGLSERDYFALSFSDDEGNQHWIYDDKRISKQLKGHPWNFNFKVKFYPPEPATLAEDRTRHLLCLQVQHDISTGKLPATLATHALLGSYVAQSVRGDYEPSLEYIDFLKNCNLAPLPNETLYEKIEELHRHHKGQTPAEADLHYLENAKKLSMYGDAKSTPVQIGISAHGINIYLDQIRVHRFLWQNIIKIGYRRNIFVIKVKPGELEKNESTTAFKLPDYEAAKRVWKCGVEHHTFFRLIQPEEKPHKGLFRWGSARFRYQGRTQFQSKMASQMFCNNQPIQRSQSVRMAEDDRNTVPVSVSQTLPLIYSEDRTCRELGWRSNQMISPEKMYSMHVTDDTQNVENNAMLNGAEVGNTNNTSGKLLDNVYSSDIFATSVATTVTSNAAITTSTIVTSTGNTAADQYSKQTSSFHASPNSTKVSRNTGPFMHEFSDDSIPRYKSDDLFENRANISALRKDNDAGFLPVKDTAVVYHPGHYEQEMTGSRGIREPPVELGDDFVLVHRPKLTSTGKIFHHNGAETNILIREEDIETYPVPCLPCSTSEKKDFEKRNLNGPILHMERSMELPTEPLTTYVYVYNQGYYDTVDPNRTDIDEKGNMRYWLRCYRKPEKSQTKLLKRKSIETRKNTEKNKSKLVRDNQAASKIGSMNEQENETQKIALIHVKQPGSKSVTVGIDADKSFSSDIMEETYDSTQPKQTCRLFISTSDSGHVRPGAYGVPSTSHDELLHNIRREEELPSLPIHEHAAICHPGISVIKDRKRRKFLIRKEKQKHRQVKHQPMQSKDQGKPLSSNMKAKPALRKTEESKDVKHAMLPVYNELATGNLLEKSEKAKRSEQSQIEHILDNTPPPVKLSRINEISFQPIHLVVKVQNQVQNPSRNYRTFKRAKHGGTVEFVAKENIDPASYKYECTPYQGPLEIIHFENGLQFAPIHDYSAVYHPGNTYVKSRKIKKRTNASEFQNEHKPSPMKIKQTAVLHLNKDDSDAKHQEEEKSDSGAFLSKNENLVTTYRAKIACKTPAKERTKVKKHPFQYRTITGDVEIIEKCFVKPETYGLVTVPYDGPLSCLEYGKELSFIPLQEYSSIYHSGISYKRQEDCVIVAPNQVQVQVPVVVLQRQVLMLQRSMKNWRRKLCCVTSMTEKEGDFPDDSKQKLEISSKSQYVQPQQQPELSESRTSTSPSQLVSTVLVKDSVKESKTDSYVKSKNEPSTTLENGENNSKHGKFDLFHFWRSADKESTIDHTADFNSLREEANIGLTTKGKRNRLSELIRMRQRNSELYDGLPLDLRSTPEISKQEITTTAMATVSSSDQANVTQMLPKTNEDVGYTAKITVKREIRSIDDLQQDSDLKVKGTNAPNDDINKKPNFIVKGFHLRGPPCESEVIHSSARYTPEKDTELTEATETSEVTVTKRHESDSVNSANKLITRGKKWFFSSLWRGSKSKDSDQDEHQKQQKLIKSDIHGIELTPVNTTSPTSELEYNILRTKVIFGSGHKEVKPSSNVARGGEQIRQDYVPVYDFSYIPNFAAFVENGEVTPATTAADMKQTEMMIVEDSVRKPDEIITGKAANETAAPPESHDESWRNVSQLNWEKLDTKMTEEHTIQCVESETFEDGKLFYQSEISSGEALDEPYIFTQTPPDIPVPMVYPTNPEASADFVEQIKRQVTQEEVEERKKRTMINTSLLHESENSNAPEIEAASHHDFLSANQSKESADKPEVINEWPSEGTKLDNQHLLLEEHKQEMYDLKNAEGVPTIHSTDTADSLPHTNFESWQKTINEPETVITTIDHHGNITKKTIKTQQVTHTVQQQMYQTSSASNQNNDSNINLIEETKKSRIPSENVASFQTSVVGTPGHNLAYESADGVDNINGNDYSDIPGELVSSRTVTQGNRTIETITYKTEKNGVVETHVEHRVTIHSCDDIDHDTELNQAILEATNMNPDMTVEKIEVKHESQC